MPKAGQKITYKPGECVLHSGVYEVMHADGSPSTQVVMLRQEITVACNKCGDQVRFRLVQAVPHISEDADFESPS